MSSLSHHGIKGQKWGVRRFQNPDGTRTAAGKKQEKLRRLKKTTSEDFISIRKTLSDNDLQMLNYDDESIKYMREHGSLDRDPITDITAHRVIQKDRNGTPVTYVEGTGFTAESLLSGKAAARIISIDLATRSGEEYRGKGHAVAAGKKMVKWFDRYGYKDYEYMEWAAKEENIASQKTAEKLGFKKLNIAEPGWTLYTYSKEAQHTSIGGTMYIEGNALILGDSSYLEHHGIRGQRWGVRRFQNRDGSLTNAGRKRLGYATKGAAQTVSKAFKAGVKAGGNAVKAVKAHHEKKEAEKLQKKKEKASKTRLGVMANKDLFTNEEIRKLNERFKLEDEMKMATLQKGVEIAKAVGTIAQNVGTVAKTYEDVTGQSLSPIKRKAAEEKARQDKEDRERRLAREDAEEARKAAKEERDIAIHEQTLRKAIAAADTQEFTAQKTKAEADSSILDAIKKGQDFNGGSDAKTDATGKSWVEKATSDGKNPFDKMIYDRDPDYKEAKDAHDEKVARQERMKYLDERIAAREKEKQAEKEARDQALRDKINQPNEKTGRSKPNQSPQEDKSDDNGGGFAKLKEALPFDKGRYVNRKAAEKARDVKENAEEERTKKQDEKAAKAAIDTIIKDYQHQDDTVRSMNPTKYDREVAASVIKGKAKSALNKVTHPVDAVAKKISDKAREEKWTKERAKLFEEYQDNREKLGTEFANEAYVRAKKQSLQNLGYRGEALDKKLNETPFSKKKKAKHDAFSIQNGTLFIGAGEPYLEHHGVKGMKWGKHLMAGKGEAGAGGGGVGEDDEKLKEMAKKAGMSVAEFRTKMASKIGGSASKVGEKVYDAAGGSHKKNAEGWRKMAREESNAARASEKSTHENSARAASQDRKYGSGGDVYRRAAESDKENAKTHHSNAKVRSERAASEQAAYEKSLAGKYDKMKAGGAKKTKKAVNELSTKVTAAKKRLKDVPGELYGSKHREDFERNARLLEGSTRSAVESGRDTYKRHGPTSGFGDPTYKTTDDAYKRANKQWNNARVSGQKYDRSIAKSVDSIKRKTRLTKDRLKSALGKSKQRKQLSTEGPKAKKQINNARDSVEKASRSNENAYKHAKAVYRQTGSDSDAYKQAIKRSGTTLQRYIDSKKLLEKKKRAKHFDDANAVYTEGTRLVINSKWG